MWIASKGSAFPYARGPVYLCRPENPAQANITLLRYLNLQSLHIMIAAFFGVSFICGWPVLWEPNRRPFFLTESHKRNIELINNPCCAHAQHLWLYPAVHPMKYAISDFSAILISGVIHARRSFCCFKYGFGLPRWLGKRLCCRMDPSHAWQGWRVWIPIVRWY